jgi:hypothetical protein
VADEDPAQQNLDVYDSREVFWHPELGELALPDGWELLPAGDAFLTRRVKAAGLYWTLWLPRSRGHDHRRKIGLLAPADVIAASRAEAVMTEERRARQRLVGARQRDRTEAGYRAEFAAAVEGWLAFAPEHRTLAAEIAHGAAEQAAVVGSGRVGRTKTLSLDERAALAARAFIRHHHTDYEEILDDVDPFGGDIERAEYQVIKQRAHMAVDSFLAAHRRTPSC